MRSIAGLLALTRHIPCGTIRSTAPTYFGRWRVSYSTSINSFDQAKQALTALKIEPENDVKLRIYALYKQATLGDCQESKPSRMNFVALAKWQAWNALKSMAKVEAETQYVQLISDLVADETDTVAVVAATASDSAPVAETHENLECSLDRGILKLCLNRPEKKNAITPEMYRIWTEKLLYASNNPEVKLVLVTGAGDYFSSGNDLSTFVKPIQSGTPIAQVAKEGRAILHRFVAAFIDCSKPLVALINGPAVGISVTTLGLYDLVVSTDHATFHTPFVSLGQTPEGCSSFTFPRIMGSLRANDMLLFNRKITAQEAHHHYGLVNRLFPKDEFIDRCDQLVNSDLVQLPAETLRYSKQIMRVRDRNLLHQVNEIECDRLAERWTSPECMHAVSQFFLQRST